MMIQKNARKRRELLAKVRGQGRNQHTNLQMKSGGLVGHMADTGLDKKSKAAGEKYDGHNDKIKKLEEIATIGRARYVDTKVQQGKKQYPGRNKNVQCLERAENEAATDDTVMVTDDKDALFAQVEYRKGVKAKRKELLQQAHKAHTEFPGTAVEKRRRLKQQERETQLIAYEKWEQSPLSKLGQYDYDNMLVEKPKNQAVSSEGSPAASDLHVPTETPSPIRQILDRVETIGKKKVYTHRLGEDHAPIGDPGVPSPPKQKRKSLHQHRRRRERQQPHMDTPAPYGAPRMPHRRMRKSTSPQRMQILVQSNGKVVRLSSGNDGVSREMYIAPSPPPPVPPRHARDPTPGKPNGAHGKGLPYIMDYTQVGNSSPDRSDPPPTGVLGLSTEIEQRSGLGSIVMKISKVWKTIRTSCLNSDVRRTGVISAGAFRLALTEHGIEISTQQVHALAVVSSKGGLSGSAPGGGVRYNQLLKAALQQVYK